LFTFAGNTENLCQVPWDPLEHTLPAQGYGWLDWRLQKLNSTWLDSCRLYLEAGLVASLRRCLPMSQVIMHI